jgi:hypothetical protein
MYLAHPLSHHPMEIEGEGSGRDALTVCETEQR